MVIAQQSINIVVANLAFEAQEHKVSGVIFLIVVGVYGAVIDFLELLIHSVFESLEKLAVKPANIFSILRHYD